MKRNLVLKALCNVAIFCALLAPVELSFTGCKSTNEVVTTSQETADQVILRAEQTAETAKTTLNLFVHVERDNEVALRQINPQIHVFAEKVRRNGIAWIQSLRESTKTFKASRTPENQASLQTWLDTLNSALRQANQYLQQSKTVTQP